MKTYLLAVLILIFGLLLNACSKSGASTLIGKWNVISDSTIISGAAISYNVYTGTNDDYFIFKNGILYTKESAQLDTYSYKFTSAYSISLIQTGALINAIPETGSYIFTGNKVRIDVSPNLLNPGFSYERIISLRR